MVTGPSQAAMPVMVVVIVILRAVPVPAGDTLIRPVVAVVDPLHGRRSQTPSETGRKVDLGVVVGSGRRIRADSRASRRCDQINRAIAIQEAQKHKVSGCCFVLFVFD